MKSGQNIIIDGDFYTMKIPSSTSYYFTIQNGAVLTINDYYFTGKLFNWLKIIWIGGYRPFKINEGGSGIFSSCIFYNLNSYDTSSVISGGVIYSYGSSSNFAILKITDCLFEENTGYVCELLFEYLICRMEEW